VGHPNCETAGNHPSQKASFENYEVEHDFTGVGRRIMLLNARQIQRVFGKKRLSPAIEEYTERKETSRPGEDPERTGGY